MGKPKLLLVDDSDNIINALTRLFKNEDFNIYSANSGEEALSILEANNVDLILCDENLPHLSGTELLRIVKTRYPQIIRIMLTGLLNIETAKAAINKGEVYKFYTKPWDDFELLVSVRHALKQKALEDECKTLKEMVNRQSTLLSSLEKEYPGISQKRLSQDGSLIIEEDEQV